LLVALPSAAVIHTAVYKLDGSDSTNTIGPGPATSKALRDRFHRSRRQRQRDDVQETRDGVADNDPLVDLPPGLSQLPSSVLL